MRTGIKEVVRTYLIKLTISINKDKMSLNRSIQKLRTHLRFLLRPYRFCRTALWLLGQLRALSNPLLATSWQKLHFYRHCNSPNIRFLSASASKLLLHHKRKTHFLLNLVSCRVLVSMRILWSLSSSTQMRVAGKKTWNMEENIVSVPLRFLVLSWQSGQSHCLRAPD